MILENNSCNKMHRNMSSCRIAWIFSQSSLKLHYSDIVFQPHYIFLLLLTLSSYPGKNEPGLIFFSNYTMNKGLKKRKSTCSHHSVYSSEPKNTKSWCILVRTFIKPRDHSIETGQTINALHISSYVLICIKYAFRFLFSEATNETYYTQLFCDLDTPDFLS